ncbi:hypothetical protein Dimus_011546 [Dionaea muscipula]
MFRLHKLKPDRPAERFDFKFSGFHALKAPKGWEKLSLSFVFIETGKTISKLGKASVRNGDCRWTETLSESLWVALDGKESLYKFVVSLGSSKSGVLGEAPINLANYTSSKVSASLSLPLENCSFGTIFEFKIQCLTPRGKLRDEQANSNLRADYVNPAYDDIETKSDASDSGLSRSGGSNSSNHLDSSSQQELGSRDPSFSASGSRSFDSVGGSSGKDFSSPRNNLMETESISVQSQDSTVSKNSILYGSQGIDDASRSNHLSYNSKVLGLVSPRVDQREDFRRNSGSHVSSPLSNADSSKDLLEGAEITTEEVLAEARTWERNARKSMLDVESLKKELSVQSKKLATLDMELSASHTECDSLKQEIKQLTSLLEESIKKQKATANMELQAQDMDQIQKELEDEIRFLKESNANLEEQQQKTQESNIELLSILQELEGIIETQKTDIENLSGKVKSEKKPEGSVEEFQIEGSTARVGNPSHDSESEDISQLQLQNLMESQKELESIIQVLEKTLEDKNHELEMERKLRTCSLLECESEWRLKLSAREEEIINLEGKLSEVLKDQGHRVSVVEAGGNMELNKEVEFLKGKVEELERDCIELTEENVQLLLKLKQYKESIPSDPVLDSSSCSPANDSLYASEEEISQLKSQLHELQQELKKKEVLEELLASNHSQAQCIDLERKCSDLEIQMQTFKDRALHLEDDLEKCHVQVEEQLFEIRSLQEQLQLFEGKENATGDLQQPAAIMNSPSDSSIETFRVFSELREQLHDFLALAKRHQLSLNLPVDHRCACCFDDLKFTEPVTQAEQIEVMYRYISQLHRLFEAHSDENGDKLSCIDEVTGPKSPDDISGDSGGISNKIVQLSEAATDSSCTDNNKELDNKISEINALKADCLLQEEEIDGLRKKQADLENQITHLMKENRQLEGSLEIVQKEKCETSQHLDEVKNEMMLLNSNMESHTAANKLLQRKSSVLEKGKQDLESQLSELEQENMDLSERISAMEAQLRYLTNEKESCRLDLQHSENQVTNLNDEIRQIESEMEAQKIDMKQKVQDMQKRWLDAQEECEYLKKSNQSLQATIENLIEECTSLQKFNADLKKQNAELNSYCGGLEAQLNDSLERFSKFSAKIEALDSDFSLMLEQISLKEKSLNSELNSLVDASKEHNDKLVVQESLLNKKYAEKVVEVANLQRELVHLIDQISAADDDKEKVSSEIMLEVSSLRSDKVKLEVALHELQEKLASLEKQHGALQMQSEARAEEIMAELSASRRKQEVLVADHEKLLSSLESARSTEEKCKSAMNGLEKNLKASEFEKIQLAEEISGLRDQLQKAASLQDEVLALKGSLNEAKFENEKLKASSDLLAGDHEQLMAEKISLVQKISKLDKGLSELDECQRAKIALEEKILRLEGDLSAREALCAQDAELKIELSRVKRANGELQRKIKHLEEDKQEFLKRVQALERKQENELLQHTGQQTSMSHDVQGEPTVSVSSSIIDDMKLTGISGQTSLKASNSGVERTEYLSKIQYLERELTEALEANDIYKTQLMRFLSDGQIKDSDAQPASDGVDEKRQGRSMLSLEIELRDLRERYFQMSLKYAEVEAQREELVMKMKSMNTKRRWF